MNATETGNPESTGLLVSVSEFRERCPRASARMTDEQIERMIRSWQAFLRTLENQAYQRRYAEITGGTDK